MAGDVASEQAENKKTRVILVGVGGASCSGKTTLAKHLKRILPNSVIIHQDDFAPQQGSLPIHPIYQVEDWDSAAGAIEWPRLASVLKEVKRSGKIPPDYQSHDHLNEQRDVSVSDETFSKWKKVFENVQNQKEAEGEEVVWGLVDGFLLYWDQDVIDQFDIRFMLRVPRDLLKSRREERSGYFTAESLVTLEGTLWKDPPFYWDGIAYPAYVDAHQHIFENGDVEKGKLKGTVDKLILLEGAQMSMSEIVERCLEELLAYGV
ncbi:hypothetical protein SERLA73DRAFT_179670 [Serpula lacrymans var. lacrymans S7.3]|uniref:Phosphoribulokinase/uridine kinase domain-containing protein n=2 Tax=Serpula lacrymans var. lacrymans TaxID=341189 RepID=F8PTW5_SERL3|nr:uncharacterized protein SERLADRAFT_464880 [Serpula lacrymans var. lacrymans S7.9]EGN99590.1 hypothetical protein SERLA73DRAFT_179670 [Serpula lacrymans var. lacrymans S7.3]EGO25159.1 hypothetical protein SERLADRAFT_464880 [Serpula lacrymans var. lacrymans S7.9]